MDTKRIKDLIDLYWDGLTTPEEESAIRAFFASNEELPPELAQWRNWFAGEDAINRMGLGDAFDNKILASIERTSTGGRVISMRRIWLSSTAVAAAVVFAWFFGIKTDQPTVVSPEMEYAEAMQEYETVKELLYFTSSQMNRAGSEIDKNLKKIEIVNEYINFK